MVCQAANDRYRTKIKADKSDDISSSFFRSELCFAAYEPISKIRSRNLPRAVASCLFLFGDQVFTRSSKIVMR